MRLLLRFVISTRLAAPQRSHLGWGFADAAWPGMDCHRDTLVITEITVPPYGTPGAAAEDQAIFQEARSSRLDASPQAEHPRMGRMLTQSR